jgi:type IV secretory pathway VirB3-like protein
MWVSHYFIWIVFVLFPGTHCLFYCVCEHGRFIAKKICICWDTPWQHSTQGPSTIQYCTVLYRTALYRTVPYCTLPYHTVLYCTVPYRTVLYCVLIVDIHCFWYALYFKESQALLYYCIWMFRDTQSNSGSIFLQHELDPSSCVQHYQKWTVWICEHSVSVLWVFCERSVCGREALKSLIMFYL